MAKTTRRALASAIVLSLAVLPWLPAQGATPKTKRVSVHSNGTESNDYSYDPSVSADGRFVAFPSEATNLVPGDTNGHTDIFVHDRKTKKTKRVNVRSNGAQALGGSSYGPSISANGRFVAFDSTATNLVPGDDNDQRDIFVHNRKTKKTKRVNVRSNGNQAEDSSSWRPSISANGRFIAFQSAADNLIGNDTNNRDDVFVHDRKTKKTKRVSVRSNGNEGNGYSEYPAISANGRFIAFESDATNLVPGDTNGHYDVFVHDRKTKKTKRVSLRSNGNQAQGGGSEKPSISASGRFIAFASGASNLVGGDTNTVGDVFVHDRKTKKTKRVSVRSNGDEGDEYSDAPSISANGRFVAFQSEATNFVADDTADGDIFVHDRKTKKTKRVSVRSNGDEPGPGDSRDPSISGDARFVAFQSNVENLVPGDSNGVSDIFVRGPLR